MKVDQSWNFLWTQEWFLNLSGDAQRILLYLVMGPQVNAIGVTYKDPPGIDFALRLTYGATRKIVTGELADEVMFDAASGGTWVLRYPSTIPPRTASELARLGHDFAMLPTGALRTKIGIALLKTAVTLPNSLYTILPECIVKFAREIRPQAKKLDLDLEDLLPPRQRAWTRLPAEEKLTMARRACAIREAAKVKGIDLDPAVEWAKLAAFTFGEPHVDVDATWRGWWRDAIHSAIDQSTRTRRKESA